MSKNYKHKPPHQGDPLLKIENNALRTKLQKATKELDTLQIALRMLTNKDKDKLIKAVEQIESQDKWFDMYSSTTGATITAVGNLTVGGSIKSIATATTTANLYYQPHQPTVHNPSIMKVTKP